MDLRAVSNPAAPVPASATPRLTLYCLPHAGGGAAHFHRWRAVLPDVEVVPLELPGHGGRLAEPVVTDLDALVELLVGELSAAPFALLGHSFGALAAYELARRARAAGNPPAVLIVCGRNGPDTPPVESRLHTLPDDELLARLRRLGGIPDEVAGQADLLRLYLPAIRADLAMAHEHRGAAGPALDIPVAAFGARDDVLTEPRLLAAWARQTTGPFELTLLPGSHFFLHAPAFVAALRDRLGRLPAAA
ncbi:thioesterase II family protein [Nonomuraea sp. NPDC004702]